MDTNNDFTPHIAIPVSKRKIHIKTKHISSAEMEENITSFINNLKVFDLKKHIFFKCKSSVILLGKLSHMLENPILKIVAFDSNQGNVDRIE